MGRRRDIWIDFNSIDDQGVVTTLAEFAEPDVNLAVDSWLVAGDDEGNLCKARVVELTPDGVVKLAVDKRIFAPADEFVDVAW
jgi:hypothetical protein